MFSQEYMNHSRTVHFSLSAACCTGDGHLQYFRSSSLGGRATCIRNSNSEFLFQNYLLDDQRVFLELAFSPVCSVMMDRASRSPLLVEAIVLFMNSVIMLLDC